MSEKVNIENGINERRSNFHLLTGLHSSEGPFYHFKKSTKNAVMRTTTTKVGVFETLDDTVDRQRR